MRRPRADAKRVAVAGGPGDATDAGAARGSGHVLDDDGLTERLSHPLNDDSPKYVGRAAWAERHDHGDGARRIALRSGKVGGRHSAERGEDEAQDVTTDWQHDLPPGLVRRVGSCPTLSLRRPQFP